MEELTDRNSYIKATNTDGICVLEATAPWCTQCKAIAPFVEKMSKKYPAVRFYTYNTDIADDIAQELGANQMPTFHLFKDGELMGGVTGAKASALENMIKENYDGEVVENID
ncbi:Squalene synthase [Teratosphaeria destructans]|uniref:Squalene synthase n=1 Tax=Teratosphaeria destructans TaxID=418781 RepID=A0A9W7SN36_9PEZI|nr:Squalene synthase [Teratosphaeria destructans]